MKSQEYIRGTIRTIVLKLLSEHDRLYGYEITQKVADLSGGNIKLTYGALYPVLYKLQEEGQLLTTSEIVDNRARKYYALTPKGQKLAEQKINELKEFIETLKVILDPGPATSLSCSWGY